MQRLLCGLGGVEENVRDKIQLQKATFHSDTLALYYLQRQNSNPPA